MSVHAGNILHVGGNNVIDRIQSAGLNNPQVQRDTIREVGTRTVVDKVPQEPDFTFSIETLDVSTDLMALLTGKVGAQAEPSGAPGAADPAGTEYKWLDVRPVNITSPWKDVNDDETGTITAGHLVPAYYPTRMQYRIGVTDNFDQTAELSGGAYYYGPGAPVEEYANADGIVTDFVTSEGTTQFRKGGALGTTFQQVFGVIVDKTPMVEGTDYTVTGGNGTPATISFTTAPAAGALVRFCYFTIVAKTFPPAVHAATTVKPGAVRGRNIPVFLGSGGTRQRMGLAQTVEIDATVDSTPERELGSEEPVGRVENGTDCTGTLTIRARDGAGFLALLSKMTGVSADEVIGFLNQNPIPLEVPIENPKDPGTILKTLYVPDAMFDIPATPARVNTPIDFACTFSSQSGTFSEFKGAKP